MNLSVKKSLEMELESLLRANQYSILSLFLLSPSPLKTVPSCRDQFQRKMEGALMKITDAVESSKEAILRQVAVIPLNF